MSNGKVKWFNNSRGYGFCNEDGREDTDIFVHFTAIKGEKVGSAGTLKEYGEEDYKFANKGETIQFDIVKTDKGEAARNVVRILDKQ